MDKTIDISTCLQDGKEVLSHVTVSASGPESCKDLLNKVLGEVEKPEKSKEVVGEVEKPKRSKEAFILANDWTALRLAKRSSSSSGT